MSDYRDKMLARKAAAAGCTVAELLERGERELQRQREIYSLHFDRAAQFAVLTRFAAAHGRAFHLGGVR